MYFQLYVYMVQYCPENYTNTNIISNCEQIEHTSYLQYMPVHSLSGQVYANIFCAICHEDLDLITDKALINCNNEDLLHNCGIHPMKHILLPQFHNSNSLSWTRLLGKFGVDPLNNCSESQSYSLTCTLKLQLKGKLNKSMIRPCHHDNVQVINYCPSQENNFCRLYSLTVYHEGRFFSNPHCASCHGVAFNATKCAEKGKTSSTFVRLSIMTCN